ncbi:hypothetical protein Tco_0938763 [Tanacetum coccineum]|uniref:Uncharacterized protein n=1 Tax=Tanacetum coccineum TaxID=301880 RepID=A0ABQ5DJX6_9ASTR
MEYRVKNEETHGKDFMDKIVVKRADDRAYIFSESHYKYLNKNDIEDICVIWQGVHDYQLGIESYQIKINLTALKLIIPGIEELEPYTIITNHFIGIVYENNKKERRVVNIEELPKIYDVTLNKVLKKVEEINIVARYGFKDPPPNEEHKEVMEFFEEEIKEHVRFIRKMRRWESFVNGRPLLSLRDHPK